jgi:hypothetical protein
MSRVKVAFAVFMVVLSASAMASSSAMATEGWLINGTLLSGRAALATTAFVDQETVLGFNAITIRCASHTLTGVSPQIESPNMGSATSLVFEECSAEGGECGLSSPKIGTLPLLTEVTLDGPLAVRGVFKAQKGETFATIKLEGVNCAEAAKLPITGDVPWLAPTGQDERTWQLLSVNVPLTGLLKVGSAAAMLEGSILLKLASSLPWSFM